MNPEEAVLAREWFYPFELPSGRVTPTYNDGQLDPVHATRLRMMNQMLDWTWGRELDGLRAVDLGCHQGFFAASLAQRGCREVLGIDARQSLVDDSNLMASALGLDNLRAVQSDIHAVDAERLGRFDIVLMFGLLYHLEDPVGALRIAHALTGRLCLIETQVAPHMAGPVDFGHHTCVKDMKGCFGIVDETDATHVDEAGTRGICLLPSTPALLWILGKIGFKRVGLVKPPPDAYEQLSTGKRVMVAAFRD
ncbi:class I SAM-dependent methyltransferase [Wenzhouxiangella sp. EGI_FJ10409]|uniref:class I SAM-dependent methyltransferase n=1 Tax=Wenzhouxiangella sp. EGI_FJ10409 TaxID=3243767 RepID=UPI0035DC280F